MSDKPLVITRLLTSNVMRLRANVEIIPTGPVVRLSGQNKQGKSSVLSAIAMALGGRENLPERPIHDGASRAETVVDLDDLIVQWRCTQGGVSLTVREKSGATVKSPQSTLDKLWNKMCDPVKFIRLSETPEGRRKQAEILRQIVGLDFTALDAEREKAYEKRRDIGRELATLQGQIAGLKFDASAPAEEVSVSDLMEELKKAQAYNQEIADQVAKREQLARDRQAKFAECESHAQTIGVLEEKLKQARVEYDQAVKEQRAIEADLAKQSERANSAKRQETAEIEHRIANSQSINAKVRSNAKLRALEKEAQEKLKRVDALAQNLEDIDTEKHDLLAAAKFPMPGLAFEESGVTINGVPFSQGSQAEQLVVATAIALALKPKIAVVLIREASLFDANTRREVAELAEKSGGQVWEEVVESLEPGTVIIEDGQVSEVKGGGE